MSSQNTKAAGVSSNKQNLLKRIRREFRKASGEADGETISIQLDGLDANALFGTDTPSSSQLRTELAELLGVDESDIKAKGGTLHIQS